MTPLRQRMIDDMTLHGLKPKTIRAYVACIARHFGKSPELLGTAEIRSYLLYLTHDRQVSSSTYNQALCALKFLYRITLPRTGASTAWPAPAVRPSSWSSCASRRSLASSRRSPAFAIGPSS